MHAMWPWKKKLPPRDERAELLANLRSLEGTMNRCLDRLEKPDPPPFLCVLVEAELEDGSPTTCGGIGTIVEPGRRIEVELQAQRPMRNGRVTVFCDLTRVNVHGIFVGVDLVQATLGSCPVAFFKEWLPGVVLRVQALEHAARA
jgi:hypothetical protein